MHIQLFISEHAPEGNRLKTMLQDTMQGIPIVLCPSIGSIGWMTPGTLHRTAVAVIMASKKEELLMLATWKSIWDRIKTILVLPDCEPETVTLGHVLRPRYISFTGSDFSDVVAVLNHIRESDDGDIYN